MIIEKTDLTLKEGNIHENHPIFSVVIPTYGRFDLVEELFVSIQKAITQSEINVEVIIVDDSPKSEQDKIEKLCKQFNYKYISGPHSVRAKRNLGIENSKGEIIFFTDSDCLVSPNIFIEHLKLYNNPDTAGVLGITEFIGKENITWKIVSKTMFFDAFSFATTLNNITDSAPWGTCTNLSFKKKVLEDVGKFDTSLPFKLGGEDTELGVRVNKAGYKIKMNPDAKVFHSRETWNTKGLVERAFRWGRADYHILKKYPELGNIAFPNFFMVLLFVVLVCIPFILTKHYIITFFIIFVWIFSTILLEATIKIVKNGEKFHYIFFYLTAICLNLIFDLGTIFESLKNGSSSMLFKRIVYTPAQLTIE